MSQWNSPVQIIYAKKYKQENIIIDKVLSLMPFLYFCVSLASVFKKKEK
jgi:hypothetical protein